MAESQFVYVTFIRTTPEKLWRALMEPEFTRQYWWKQRSNGNGNRARPGESKPKGIVPTAVKSWKSSQQTTRAQVAKSYVS